MCSMARVGANRDYDKGQKKCPRWAIEEKKQSTVGKLANKITTPQSYMDLDGEKRRQVTVRVWNDAEE